MLGSVASLIEIDRGWEAATAAALGQLSNAIVVRDLSSAVDALTILRSKNLGKADVLVYEPGQSANRETPSGLTSLLTTCVLHKFLNCLIRSCRTLWSLTILAKPNKF